MSTLEMIEQGEGQLVVLFHGAASHSGQWRQLIDRLKSNYRVVGFNQYGYGRSSSWSEARAMTFKDQVKPVIEYLKSQTGPLHLVGHSHGATLAALTATLVGDRVRSLSIYEPNSFCVLDQDAPRQREQYELIRSSFGDLAARGATPETQAIFAEELLDFWLGRGAWRKLPDRLQGQLISMMKPTINEVHAALHCPIDIRPLYHLKNRVLLMFDPHTPPAALEVSQCYQALLPHCRTQQFPHGGHLAPVFHPHQINEAICHHLEFCASLG